MAKNKKVRRVGSFNTVTSCISTSLVLIVLGVVVFLTCISQSITRSILENFSMDVLLDDTLPKTEIRNTEKFLREQKFVKSTTFTSKEQAAKDLAESMGENPEDFLGANPFPASFEVHVKAEYANNDSLARYLPAIQKRKGVTDVIYKSDLVENVHNNMKNLALILLCVAGLLCVISVSLINNTMKLSAYSHRYAIHTMKLVGARWRFIRWPFMRSAFWMGFFAATIASVVVLGGIQVLWYWEPDRMPEYLTPETLTITFGSIYLIGILMTTICAVASVNRFLRLRGNKVFLQ